MGLRKQRREIKKFNGMFTKKKKLKKRLLKTAGRPTLIRPKMVQDSETKETIVALPEHIEKYTTTPDGEFEFVKPSWGRNEKCYCGSGVKRKKCCLKEFYDVNDK